MNMFARFDENPAITLQDIKETKRYGRTDWRTDGQRENSIPTTNNSNYTPGTKYIGVYSFCLFCNYVCLFVCLSVCLSVNFFFRQRFLSNYLG